MPRRRLPLLAIGLLLLALLGGQSAVATTVDPNRGTGDQVLALALTLAEWKAPGEAKNHEGSKRLDARLSYEKVLDIVTSHREQTLVHLSLSNGDKLTATEGHPFKTTDGWRDAVLLKKGGKLLLRGKGDEPPGVLVADSDGAFPERIATITEIRIERLTVPVFNLEVANAHTFYVGVDGALVHNGFGSYTCHFKSGKKYHGKGDWNRAIKSDKDKFDKYRDELEFIDWTPADSDKDSFRDEHKRMETDGGPNKSRNYNKRRSPGRRY